MNESGSRTAVAHGKGDDVVPDNRPSDRTQTPFETFGALFLPHPGRNSPGVARRVIEPDPRWRTREAVFDGVDAAVWGRLSARRAPARRLLWAAIRRELALAHLILRRETHGLRVGRIHRLPPASRPGRLQNLTRLVLRGGLAVELGLRESARVLDVVVEASGVRPNTLVKLRPSGDGSAHATAELGNGRPVFLRVAGRGGLRDLTRNASALRVLAAENVEATPRLIDEGEIAGTAWTLETAMPGRSVRRPAPMAFASAVRFAMELPRSPGIPRAPMTAATDLAAAFPERSDAFRDIALEVQAAVARLGSVLEHGDYWFGNLLLKSGRITGVVDWDSWAAGGVPGTDLLQLYASTQRRTRRDLGDLLLARIWADAPFRKLSEPYWQTLGIEPTEAERQAVAVAWWLGQMAAASRLGRGRLAASYPLWVRKNIDAVLEQLAASMRGTG